MTIDRNASLAQIVLAHPATARIFQRHGLDYCCRGDVALGAACEAKGIAADAVVAEAEAAVAARAPAGIDARALSTGALVEYVVARHHGYLRDALPSLRPLADKVARVHGEHNPKLVPLARTFHAIADALEPHLVQEEQVLFPALLAPVPDAAVVARELASMHEDHLAVGTLLGELRAQADEFTTPEWGCTSYRTLMAELEALEGDVLAHVHLENHVLMPRFAARREGAQAAHEAQAAA
jgi:regulator of cell morphogenesis and NO signaling